MAAPAARFFVLRHGQSTANVSGTICSRSGPAALETVGLTPLGRDQARSAAADTDLGPDTIVVTSDFARARETAELFAEGVGAAAPLVDERLRERDFGELDGGPDTGYAGVWEADAADVPAGRGIESPQHVAHRVAELRSELEARYPGRDVVLVAHGDVLQIAVTDAAGISPHRHREVPHLGNAELRPLVANS